MSSESIPPNDYDQGLFENVGHALMFDIVSVICETSLWALHLVLFIWAVRLQMRNPRIISVPNILILLATVLLFLSSSSLWGMNITWLVVTTQKFFLKFPTLSIADRVLALNEGNLGLGISMEGLFLMNMIIGDAIVIWRAWAICTDTPLQKLVYVPMITLATSFAFTVISLNCLVVSGFSTKSSISPGSKVCQWSEPLAWAISLFTNVTSTSLIAWRALQHHRFLRMGHIDSGKSKSQRIMVIVIESGFVYCLFWLTQLHLFFDYHYESNFISFFHAFLNAVGDQISGIYPTLIIILVHMQRSLSDDMSKISHSIASSTLKGTPRNNSRVSTIFFRSREEIDVEKSVGASEKSEAAGLRAV